MYLQRQFFLSEAIKQQHAAKQAEKAAKRAHLQKVLAERATKSQILIPATSNTRESCLRVVERTGSSTVHPSTATTDEATVQNEFTVISGYKLENRHDPLPPTTTKSADPQATNANDAAVQHNISATSKLMSERGRFSLRNIAKKAKACLRKAVGKAAAVKNISSSDLRPVRESSRPSIMSRVAHPYSKLSDAASISEDEHSEIDRAAEISPVCRVGRKAHLSSILEDAAAECPCISIHRRFSWENGHDSFDLVAAKMPHLTTGDSNAATTSASQASTSRLLLETYRDSIELTREAKPNLLAVKEVDAPAQLDSIAEIAEIAAEICPQPAEPMQATRAGLFSEAEDDAVACNSISVSLHHEIAIGQERLETVAQSKISLPVTERTTLQELRYKLQRRAAEMAFDDDTQAGQVFGFVLIVNDGETEALAESMWKSRRDWMRSGCLEYRFQVLSLDDSKDFGEEERVERTSEFGGFV